VVSVVDLGGNIGLATLWFAREFPDARLTTIEADPTNADVLERVVALNRVGTRIITVPMIDVLPILAEADFLKMDIEGGEWEILSDPLRRHRVDRDLHGISPLRLPDGRPDLGGHGSARRRRLQHRRTACRRRRRHRPGDP
jgi:hypothetical protein